MKRDREKEIATRDREKEIVKRDREKEIVKREKDIGRKRQPKRTGSKKPSLLNFSLTNISRLTCHYAPKFNLMRKINFLLLFFKGKTLKKKVFCVCIICNIYFLLRFGLKNKIKNSAVCGGKF